MTDPDPSARQERFVSQATTTEDLLKSQTVGLVHLSEFRKRRADALEQNQKQAQDATPDTSDGWAYSYFPKPLAELTCKAQCSNAPI